MPRRFLALVLAAAAAGGCTGRRDCVPAGVATGKLVDLSADPNEHAPVQKGLHRELEDEFRRRAAGRQPPGSRPYHTLALSGGGMYGAFAVGLLTGWTEAGTRPEFDVVTGISTGGLAATYAFLGPAYDAPLRAAMVGVEQKDILRRRPLPAIPFAPSAFRADRFARRIERWLPAEVLREVAAAHAAGRRLYVGTTNIDTKRLVIWDMGAIAARNTPAADQLYRDVILASSAVPGIIPPVRVPVEIDGKEYTELHVDGGVSDEVIFRAFMVGDLNRAAGLSGAVAPAGSTLTVVVNGKLYAEPTCVRPRFIGLVPAAARSIISGKTRDEMYRIHLNCLETGVEFRLAAVPQDVRLGATESLNLSRADQETLYQVGRRVGAQGRTGPDWRDEPPGVDPSEQAMPRTGTKFATPGR